MKMSMRARLIALSAATLMPVLLFATIMLQENVDYTKSQVLANNYSTVELASSQVDSFIIDHYRLLQMLARMAVVKEKRVQEVSFLFAEIRSTQPYFFDVFAADERGRLFASATNSGRCPRSIAEDEEFSAALRTDMPSASGWVMSCNSGQPAVRLVVPLHDELGHQIGVVGAEISLRQLQQGLTSLEKKEQASIMVVDGGGVVLVHPDWRIVVGGRRVDSLPPVAAALRGDWGTMEFDSPEDDQSWLAAYAPVRWADWAVTASRNSGIAYPPVKATALRGGMFLSICVVLAVLLATILARRVTEPLRQLRQAAVEMAQGNVNTRVVVKTGDELEDLANAFNDMSAALGSNLAELTRTKDALHMRAEELHQLLAKTIDVQEEERKMVANDLHDGLSHQVVGALYEVQAAMEFADHDPSKVVKKLHRAQALLNQIVEDLHGVIFALRPVSLDELGLVTALRRHISNFQESSGIDGQLVVEGQERRLSHPIEVAAFRVVQEALHNARRHSMADSTQVVVRFSESLLSVEIRDNGRGFRIDETLSGLGQRLGLIGMRERATAVNGRLSIRSAPDQGTHVALEIPLGTASPRGNLPSEVREAGGSDGDH